MFKKELLATGTVRDIKFADKLELTIYLHRLERDHKNFKVLETYERPDGTVLARIVQAYNDSPLIELYMYSD